MGKVNPSIFINYSKERFNVNYKKKLIGFE